MLKPRKLSPGDRLAAVSLSWGGPGAFPHRYAAGKRQLEEAFEVELVAMPHALKDPDWLAAHPEARAEDLTAAFADPSIQGVISTIGGEDSIRLIPHLDLGVLSANPKVFLGYSDTTVAHFACLKAGLVSFYGPSVMAGFGENGGMFPYMIESVRRTLFSAEPVGVVEPNPDGWTAEFLDWSVPENQEKKRKLQPSEPWRFLWKEGIVEGPLVGGCLEVLEFLRGTPLWPDDAVWDGAILFLETSEEAPPPAVLKRALRSYAAMGILKKLAGILLGRPGGPVTVADFGGYEDALIQVVVREEGLTELPIVTRMDFGHTDPMFVLPQGVRARIDCGAGRFSIVEGAVTDA
ncbi:MAG TPA: S66 peptidase family protein [Thermoanaerobaculia bacterium]|jgi:muramoyltetrapeptide carboxypeptidase LdcA involved in peptidoglycan recycling|nr:S66 peptidase family protein [Thermoanaerobaculia bacterium]